MIKDSMPLKEFLQWVEDGAVSPYDGFLGEIFVNGELVDDIYWDFDLYEIVTKDSKGKDVVNSVTESLLNDFDTRVIWHNK